MKQIKDLIKLLESVESSNNAVVIENYRVLDEFGRYKSITEHLDDDIKNFVAFPLMGIKKSLMSETKLRDIGTIPMFKTMMSILIININEIDTDNIYSIDNYDKEVYLLERHGEYSAKLSKVKLSDTI